MAKSKGKKKRPTTVLPNGAKFVLDGPGVGQGEAYDSKGRWLGFSDENAIRNAAENEFLIDTSSDTVCELSVWELWNDAVANLETRPMQGEDGAQVLAISADVFLRVEKDPDGWSCDWLTRSELEERYYDDLLQCFRLRWADHPFRLE